VVPGSDGAVTDAEAPSVGAKIGFPVLVKAASGGGGKGMKVANSAAELPQAVSLARKEAKANFGDDAVYLEKYLSHPRHIEIQILADGHGNVVHLGERDCSLQRRHQKVLEEAPSPALNANQRAEVGRLAANAMRKLGYRSAGTIEFLFQDGAFYFIEMNTRLQVEHPVTEMITGIDLVREQIRVATGALLPFTQDQIVFNGHAIECRINAENPETFMPSPGRVTDYHAPGGLGVRVDSALYAGYQVPSNYDSLIAKLIVHGTSRNECMMRLRRALEEFVIGGIDTSIPLHQRLIAAPDFLNGDYDIRWLEKFVSS
jgi:acetyl-CoA carboxylase biotin carboxylase subunit